MPLQRVKPGQGTRISASTFNAHTRATEIVLNQHLDQKDGKPGTPASGVHLPMANSTGARLSPFRPVGFGTFFHDPTADFTAFMNEPIIRATSVTPNIWTFGITQDYIDENAIDDVLISGVTICQVNVLSTAHRYAYMSNNGPLRSYWWGGAKILQIESGTGLKWAVVQLGHGECPAYCARYIGPHYSIHVPPDSGSGTDTGFTMPYDGASGSELFPNAGNVTPGADDHCVIVWARSLASGGGGLGGNPMAIFLEP